MTDFYLIDGYNLIHAMGLLPRATGPGGLEKARLGLLGLLKGAFKDEAPRVTVVFDASGAPPGIPDRHDYQGLVVHFARGNQQADDLIEKLILEHSAPRSLHVVSDDHRLQQAARHRRARPLACEEFLDLLLTRRRKSSPPPPLEKQDKPSEQEMKDWLREFGHLDRDLEDLF